HLHLDLRPAKTLSDLATVDPASVDDELFGKLLTQDSSGVQLVQGSDAPENAELVTVPLVQHGIDRLRAATDYVVVDTPATFTQQTLAAIDASDAIVIVAEPHVASVKACKAWLDVL